MRVRRFLKRFLIRHLEYIEKKKKILSQEHVRNTIVNFRVFVLQILLKSVALECPRPHPRRHTAFDVTSKGDGAGGRHYYLQSVCSNRLMFRSLFGII